MNWSKLLALLLVLGLLPAVSACDGGNNADEDGPANVAPGADNEEGEGDEEGEEEGEGNEEGEEGEGGEAD